MTKKKLEWSNANPIPQLGDVVEVRINGIGKGEVVGFFDEVGYAGVVVKPFDPPQWYINQNGKDEPCHVFGAELKIDPDYTIKNVLEKNAY